ncbi:uncharacterized protein LOC113540067 [Pangasianodon hypophthalmus]|uniref:uncharacterized protein LOC113540067 n=1 Tax=Pangasianodon hypophthalmus TaxID=310915 RepID=UPI002307D944|nr:uncharacterized protein LOC113540067 [Pangasianodon hypophthalmus]
MVVGYLVHFISVFFFAKFLDVQYNQQLVDSVISRTQEAKNTSPSLPTLSILSFHTEKEKQETCLAAGFFPKQGPLSLSKGDSTTNFKVDNAALSSTGTYYFAAFSEEIDICKMKNINITKNDGKKSTETVTVQTSTCEPPSSISDSRSGNQTGLNEISGSGDPKGNMMALIVTFLRITFAKAVGVNIMMTVKAFLV